MPAKRINVSYTRVSQTHDHNAIYFIVPSTRGCTNTSRLISTLCKPMKWYSDILQLKRPAATKSALYFTIVRICMTYYKHAL